MKISKIVSCAILSVAVTGGFASTALKDSIKKKTEAIDTLKTELQNLDRSGFTNVNLESDFDSLQADVKTKIKTIMDLSATAGLQEKGRLDFTSGKIKGIEFEANKIKLYSQEGDTEKVDTITRNGEDLTYDTQRIKKLFILDEINDKSPIENKLTELDKSVDTAGALYEFLKLEKVSESLNGTKAAYKSIFEGDYSQIDQDTSKKLNGVDPENVALTDVITRILNSAKGFSQVNDTVALTIEQGKTVSIKKTANGAEFSITSGANTDTFSIDDTDEITFAKGSAGSPLATIYAKSAEGKQALKESLLKILEDNKNREEELTELKKFTDNEANADFTKKIFVNELKDAFSKATGKSKVESFFDDADPSNEAKEALAAYNQIFEALDVAKDFIENNIDLALSTSKAGENLTILSDGTGIQIGNDTNHKLTKDFSGYTATNKIGLTNMQDLKTDLKGAIDTKIATINDKNTLVKFYNDAVSVFADFASATYNNVFGVDNADEYSAEKLKTFFKDNKDTLAANIIKLIDMASDTAHNVLDKFILENADGSALDISLKNSNGVAVLELKNDTDILEIKKSTTEESGIAFEAKKVTGQAGVADPKALITALAKAGGGITDGIKDKFKETKEADIKSAAEQNFLKTFKENLDDLLGVDIDQKNKADLTKLLKGDEVKQAARDQLAKVIEKGASLEKPLSVQKTAQGHIYKFTLKNESGKGVITIEQIENGKVIGMDTIKKKEDGKLDFVTTVSGNTVLAKYASVETSFDNVLKNSVDTNDNLGASDAKLKEIKEIVKALKIANKDDNGIATIIDADYARYTDNATAKVALNGEVATHNKATEIKSLLELAKLSDENIVITEKVNDKTYTITIHKDDTAGIDIAYAKADGETGKDNLKLVTGENGLEHISLTADETHPVLKNIENDKTALSSAIEKFIDNAKKNTLTEHVLDDIKNLVTKDSNSDEVKAAATSILAKIKQEKFAGILETLPNKKLEIELDENHKVVIEAGKVKIEHTHGTTKTDMYEMANEDLVITTADETEDPVIKSFNDSNLNAIIAALTKYKESINGDEIANNLKANEEAEIPEADTNDKRTQLELAQKTLEDEIANETTTPEDKEKAQKALDKVNEKLAAASAVKPEVDALDAAKTELESAPDDDSKIQAVKAAKEALAAATAKRAEIAAKKAGLTEAEKNIAESLAKLATKGEEVAVGLLSGNKLSTREDLIAFVKDVTASATASTENISKAIDLDIVKFNTDLATQTRLARLANPFNQDLALASAINKLGGSKFADAGNGIDSIIKDYTSRFTHDNNLWGTMLGGKAKSKGGANPSIYGFTLGYDKAFDNAIVGSYISYAKSKANSTSFTNKTDNYQFGVYNRTYFGVNELDAKLTFNIGKNKLERNVLDITNEGKFNSLTTSLDVDYGRVYDLDKSTYVKPFAGFSYTHLKSKSFKESGNLALEHNGVKSTTLALRAGAEFRKYVDNGNYLYVTPGIQSELHKKSSDKIVRFVGTENDIILGGKDKKQTYFTLQTGAEININQNLSTNINFGTKVSKDNKFYNGTIGLRYKF